MKHFIIKSIVIVFIFGLFCYCLDFVVSTGLRKSNYSAFAEFTKITSENLNADLVINGSSKAFVQVSPKIIDSILNLNSYNLGLDGNRFISQNLKYKLYKQHNLSPKIVIQIIGSNTLEKKEELYNYIYFAPYLNDVGVKEVVKTYKGFSLFSYYFPLIKYSGHPTVFLDGFFNFFGIKLFNNYIYKGYNPQNKSWDSSFKEFKKTNKTGIKISLTNESIDLFEDYIIECKKNKIILFLVYPPTYYESQKYILNRNEVITLYENMSIKYDIPFFNYSNGELSKKKIYFYNSQHLNKGGAEIFTTILSQDIQDYLLKKSKNINLGDYENN